MTARRLVAVALLAVVALTASPAGAAESGWRVHLPAGWLAALEAPNLDRFDALAKRLLAPWGRSVPPLSQSARGLAQGIVFNERPWGLALVASPEGDLGPTLFVPTDDHEGLCRVLNADAAGDLSVTSVAGYDIALIDRDGWSQLALVENLERHIDRSPDVEEPVAEADQPPQWGEQPLLSVTLSPAGTRLFAKTLDQRRRGQLQAGRGRLGRWEWPSGFGEAIDRMAPYAPLAAELSASESPLVIGLSEADGDIQLSARLGAGPPPHEAEAATAAAAPDGAVAHAALTRPLPSRLIDLAIAWMRCRPDDIDAPDYPQPEWDDLASAYRRLLGGVRSGATVFTLPAEGQPVAANQITAFEWTGGADQLGDALRLLVVRWNQLIDAAEARTPLRIEMEPLEASGGWRLMVDLVSGMGLPPSPELDALFDRYYGSGNQLQVDVTPRGQRGWLVTIGPDHDDPWPLASQEAPPGSVPLLGAQLWVDRWIAWGRLVADVDMGDALGRRIRPPMAESPPATLRLEGDDTLHVEFSLPYATYEAATAYWRAEKQPVE